MKMDRIFNAFFITMFFSVSVLSVFYLSPAYAAGVSVGTLTINITGFKSDEGFAMISVVNSQKDFDEEVSYRKFKSKIKNGCVAQLVENLEFGKYGVKIFHDENENGKIDTRMFGIPVERYGFSNNARGKFGPPKYEEVKFMFEKPEMAISVEVK